MMDFFSVDCLILKTNLKSVFKRIADTLSLLIYKGDVLLEFSSVKWVLNEDHTLYCNLLGTLLLQNFVLVNSYFIDFFVG